MLRGYAKGVVGRTPLCRCGAYMRLIRCFSTSAVSLPTIELCWEKEERRSTNPQLFTELTKHGFCYVRHPALTNPSLPLYTHNLLESSRRVLGGADDSNFFSLGDGVRGGGTYSYIGKGASAAGASAGVGKSGIRCLSVEKDGRAKLRHEYFAANGGVSEAVLREHLPPMRWPTGCTDEDKALFRGYHEECCCVADCLIEWIAHNAIAQWGADADPAELAAYTNGALSRLHREHGKHDVNLELKLYTSPDVDSTAGATTESSHQVSLDEHVDLSTVTLVAQDGDGLLEVWDAATGKYLPVARQDDALLCNVGKFLEVYSNGTLRATPHRVRNGVNADGRGRCSAVLFYWPNYETRVEPLWGLDAEPAESSGGSEHVAATCNVEPVVVGDVMPYMF